MHVHVLYRQDFWCNTKLDIALVSLWVDYHFISFSCTNTYFSVAMANHLRMEKRTGVDWIDDIEPCKRAAEKRGDSYWPKDPPVVIGNY